MEGDMLSFATETRKRQPIMIDLYVELKALLQALDAAGIPYALCGGLALMVYQRPRATVDIDLILPAEVTGKCIEAVAPLGFRAHPRPMRFGTSGIEVHRLYKVEEGGPDVLMLDCLLPPTRSSLRPGVAVCGSPSEKERRVSSPLPASSP
jgi:hypothetical protein